MKKMILGLGVILFCVGVQNSYAQCDECPSSEERKEYGHYSGTDCGGYKDVGYEWHLHAECGYDRDGNMRLGWMKIKRRTCVTWTSGRKGDPYYNYGYEWQGQCADARN